MRIDFNYIDPKYLEGKARELLARLDETKNTQYRLLGTAFQILSLTLRQTRRVYFEPVIKKMSLDQNQNINLILEQTKKLVKTKIAPYALLWENEGKGVPSEQ